jgi:NAD(P) transhydrogenase subunit alpha
MSLGARFIMVEGAADASKAGGYAVEQSTEYQQKQEAMIAASIAKADIVITTAQIPGKPAPKLITLEMLSSMRAGGVIIDLAAGTGGNTPITKDNETVEYNGITIIGHSNLASTMPADASKLYAKNVYNFLQLLIKDGKLVVNLNDEIIKGACITHEGTMMK